MSPFRIVWLILYIYHEMTEGSLNLVPIVFVDLGNNVTITSNFETKFSPYLLFSWYIQSPGGLAGHVAYFSSYSFQYSRYTGKVSQDSPCISLTISEAKLQDSGQYFPVVLMDGKVFPGSSSYLVVTDPQAIPSLQVFGSYESGNKGEFLCELGGVGTMWSDPHWEMEGEFVQGSNRTKAAKTAKFINDKGVFTRSSLLSVTLQEGILRATCVSTYGKEAIRRPILVARSKRTCLWLQNVLIQCVALLLVTVTAILVWLRRIYCRR